MTGWGVAFSWTHNVYRTIESSFWSDPKVRSLSPEAKFIFLYLITNDRSHVSGIYYLPIAVLEYETGLKPDTLSDRVSRVEQGLTELESVGIVAIDREREVFWVKKMMTHQGRGPKNFASAAKQLGTLHNSPLIKDFCKMYPKVKYKKTDRVSDRVVDRIAGAGSDSSQEQEQEQEQNIPLASPKGKVGLSLPKEIDTPEMREAWSDWLRFRKEKKKPLTETTIKQNFRDFADWGVKRAIAAIRFTIGKGWQGLQEPGLNGHAAVAQPIDLYDECLRKQQAADEKELARQKAAWEASKHKQFSQAEWDAFREKNPQMNLPEKVPNL